MSLDPEQETSRVVRAVGARLVELLLAAGALVLGWCLWSPLAWLALVPLAWIVIDPVRQKVRHLVRQRRGRQAASTRRITNTSAEDASANEPARSA